VLVQQPVIDPPDGVPLLAGRVEISPQDVVDRRLERIKLQTRGGIALRGPTFPQRHRGGSPRTARSSTAATSN